MPGKAKTSPVGEQDICVRCGFCCDGTLFVRACLSAGERGTLPAEIEKASFTERGSDYFRLPCNYFFSKCTIYDIPRANVCSEYRCQLLKDFDAGKVTKEEAMGIVADATKMRDSLLEQYKKISGRKEKISFQRLLTELGRIQGNDTGKEPLNNEYDILLAGCNIFEALMTKYIRSKSDFDKMMGEESKVQS
jgi:hypothetical protein